MADGNSVEYAGKAVDKAFKDLSFPDRPLVVGFNADPKAAEAIRDDEADAVADVAYDASLWVALDRIGEKIGRNEELNSVSVDDYPPDFMDIPAGHQGQRAGQEEVPRAEGGPRDLLHREVERGVRLAARARLSRPDKSPTIFGGGAPVATKEKDKEKAKKDDAEEKEGPETKAQADDNG